MSDIQDVIQAFIDGEPVDPVELERALADPDGRAYLIDVVVLRKLVKRSHAAALMAATPVAGALADRLPRRTWRWLTAAAMVAVAASAGGYIAGERAWTSRAPVEASAPVVVPDAPIVDASPAPAPTVVIRFQPGVDWTERGGH